MTNYQIFSYQPLTRDLANWGEKLFFWSGHYDFPCLTEKTNSQPPIERRERNTCEENMKVSWEKKLIRRKIERKRIKWKRKMRKYVLPNKKVRKRENRRTEGTKHTKIKKRQTKKERVWKKWGGFLMTLKNKETVGLLDQITLSFQQPKFQNYKIL